MAKFIREYQTFSDEISRGFQMGHGACMATCLNRPSMRYDGGHMAREFFVLENRRAAWEQDQKIKARHTVVIPPRERLLRRRKATYS